MARPLGVPILVKLLAAVVVPALALFVAFALLTYAFTRRELERETGKRLESIAAFAASQLRGKYLVTLQPGEEGDEEFSRARGKLLKARTQTAAARITVFDRDYRTLCDTDEGIAIGTPHFDAEQDRLEVARVFDQGVEVASVTFRGADGRYYRRGYAPVRASTEDPTVVAALGVQAPATYFESLRDLRAALLRYGATLAVVVGLAALVVATLLTRPIRRLDAAAERIGAGDLTQPVDVRGGDELGRLGRTLDGMREALRARDERLQMMLAGIAHEVRNPLGGIELWAGILRDDLPPGDEKRTHVAKIERETGRLKAVVTEFLEFARRVKPELTPGDLAPLLDEVVEVARPEAAASSITLTLERPSPLPCRHDAGQLRRALLNLVMNGIQATDAGGAVTIAARATAGGGVEVTVTDTGKGMDPSTSGKIFAPFFTTKEKGTGLGLAFVREIVADHGGTIGVESAVGKGTTFSLRLGEQT